MPQIRPVSDLRNNFAEISRIVHESRAPVFLTKNGFGDMVVMSMAQYEKQQLDADVFYKLKVAEAEAKTTTFRHTHAEVMDGVRKRIQNAR
ncbi:MAG: type II toxin-antitoxin system Phd/YefM family antitoxin [Clostridiales bacterium]|nr:type II toxin-antitoxin system Phd/YefM family antitoxin [Clostridiales bacterium]